MKANVADQRAEMQQERLKVTADKLSQFQTSKINVFEGI
jgi:hypothetical protein